MHRRAALAAILFVCLIACKKRTTSGGGPFSTGTQLPPPAPPQAPIRDNTTLSEFKSGAAARVRLFVSTLTDKDPVRFGLQLAPDKPIDTAHPWTTEQLDWTEAVAALTFEIEAPSGKTHAFQVGQRYAQAWKTPLAQLTQEISIDGNGLGESHGRLPWKAPKPDLLAEVGKYSLRITGSIRTDKLVIEVASKPIEFQVVAHAAGHKSLAELEDAARALIVSKESPKHPPKQHSPIIDDVNGNLWTRFRLDDPRGNYDIDIIEALLDPSGKEVAYDHYRHFTCVAAGTSIATPAGEVPIERLQVGDRVKSYDPATKRAGTSTIERIERSSASRLYAFGELSVTGNHPIFVDGRWQEAHQVEVGGRLIGLHGNSIVATPEVVFKQTDVYDLSVSAPHTFFAGGVLVHNKAVHVPLGGNQPWRGWFYRRAAKP